MYIHISPSLPPPLPVLPLWPPPHLELVLVPPPPLHRPRSLRLQEEVRPYVMIMQLAPDRRARTHAHILQLLTAVHLREPLVRLGLVVATDDFLHTKRKCR